MTFYSIFVHSSDAVLCLMIVLDYMWKHFSCKLSCFYLGGQSFSRSNSFALILLCLESTLCLICMCDSPLIRIQVVKHGTWSTCSTQFRVEQKRNVWQLGFIKRTLSEECCHSSPTWCTAQRAADSSADSAQVCPSLILLFLPLRG